MRYFWIVCLFFMPLHGAGIQSPTNDVPPEKTVNLTSEIDTSLRTMDQVIGATERTLSGQRQIRQQLIEYRDIKAKYLQDQENRDLIVRMVKAAYGLQNTIKALHCEDTLDGELLHELAFFSQIATKKSLPKP